ncbi:hypothetical protein C3B58_12800 [Lactonifactor longoviformis]|uniref:Uncharacterized protein n=1 Tax=Lactonifactor longoviformis DSM 17459 TaxID=1122155 RepID=A0A1M5D5Q1_9CLOT|nr:hypothetical protein [Lactonifactor longoviformis]POP32276.1 hypothetical protein C3B58_12800 [Lactonifactor longoviformis]SHF62403.1 hypothetical protein SAMN02745158_04429 [Lactonifactor longoviformis DSM 17459]
MIKEALQYIVGLQQPKIIESGDSRYTDVNLRRIDEELRADAIEMTTLSGLIEYIKAGVDDMADSMLVQVVSPTEVRLISQLDFDRKRECLVAVKADIPEFAYGKFIDSEAFLIGVRSKFIQNDGAEAILKFAGTVESGTVAKYGDDGVSQSAIVKKGVASKEERLVPNPVKLRPYRTFTEVKQPESEFVFRMKDDSMSVYCALFEADGGAWKREAMKNIKEHLEIELAELPRFTVIS